MLVRVDLRPGIARDDPALRRLGAERIQVFGLAGQKAHDLAALEQPARRALAHERDEVAREGDVVDRLRLGREQGLHGGPRLDLAERRPLLLDELDLGLALLQQPLELGDRGLAVFVVRRDGRPAGRVELGGLVRQHAVLHVGRGPQPPGVGMALLPGERGRERLGGDEQHLLLLGEIGHREADVGEEGAGQQRHALARDQLVGERHGVGRLAAVVARDHLERAAAEHAAGGVDLLDRELPALLVGQREPRKARVAVDLADLDRFLLRAPSPARTRPSKAGAQRQEASAIEHGVLP